MGRNSWIIFGLVAVVIVSLLLVALLILVPQSEPVTTNIYEDYEPISKDEYSYDETKDISEDAMKETYSVTTEDIKIGKSSKLYKQGNSDPFADKTEQSASTSATATTSGTTSSTTSSATASTSGGSTTTSTGTTTSNSTKTVVSAEDK